MTTPSLKNLLLLLVPGVLWGGAFLLVELILVTIPPFTLTLGRNFISTIALWLMLYWLGGRLPRTWAPWKHNLFLGLVNNTLPFVLVSWGQLFIESGLATILISTMPLFTILLAHFLTDDEHLTTEKIIGITLGMVGILVLMGPTALQGLGENLWGQLAVLGAALCYAIGGIYTRQVFRQNQRQQNQSQWTTLVEVTTGQFIAATLFVLPGSLLLEQPWALQPSLLSMLSLLALALVVTIGAILVYYYLIDVAGVTMASIVIYLIPINGVFWGAVVLDEPITWQVLVALALILVGTAIINGLFKSRSTSVQSAP
ncbi:MAG: DMT family transporter [Chloroflexota bacterium]